MDYSTIDTPMAFGFTKNSIVHFDDQMRQWFQNQIIGDLAERRVTFFRIGGALLERIARVDKILSRYQKYINILDIRPDE